MSGSIMNTRRSFLAGSLAIGAASTLFKPAILKAQPTSLVVATTGGKTEEALVASVFRPFTEKTGIDIVQTSTVYAKVKAMVDANSVEWDVMSADAAIAASFSAQNLLEPLDYGVINRADFLNGIAKDSYLPNDVAAAVMGWSSNAIEAGQEPRNWAEFWDTGHTPGQRGLWRQPFQTLEIALMADGVDKDALYPLDVERAIASLDRIRSDIYWWSTGAQSTQILLDAEVPLAMGWNGRLFDPRASGGPVDFSLNQALFVGAAWAIPKGAPNASAAMDFIAFAMEPEQQAAYANYIPYGPVNTKALDLLTADRLRDIPSSQENIKLGVFQDYDWWAEHGEATANRFNDWLLS